ncbi:MAG: adenylosuccinate synthetase [Stellaceae bacterium]
MPVSVVVGGQYGSEGKGKVALHVALQSGARAVVRVGGPNSGHTGIDHVGKPWVFRQLPAAALASDTLIVLPAGSLIDPDILLSEIRQLNVEPERLIIDNSASVVLPRHRLEEAKEDLVERIGSTGSGTGAALRDRMSRNSKHLLAGDYPPLKPFTRPFVARLLRDFLRRDKRVVIEGTQGFGLSLWHGTAYPHATSRDTTAASFVAESGLAPHDVDDVILVVRSFPIRVGGNSGPLENEIDWPTLAAEAGLPPGYVELTSATKRVRRIARFHPEIVRRAIVINQPHRIVMNHFDYIDPTALTEGLGSRGWDFLAAVEQAIGRRVDLIGLSPSALVRRVDQPTPPKAAHASFA